MNGEKMTFLNLSRWSILGPLVLMVSGAFSPSAKAIVQSADLKSVQDAGQELSIAKLAVAPVANLSTVSAPTTAAPAPPPPSSSHSWTGFYVGVNAGHGTANADTTVNPLPTAATFVNLLPQTLKLRPSGALGGAQVGFNKEFGHLVVGVEGDIDAAGIDDTFIETPIIQNNNTPFPGAGNHILVHQRTDAISTVRPRVCFLLGHHFLLYGTGGLAIAHIGYTASTDFRPVGTTQYNANFSNTQTGWIAGGGAEVGVGGGFSVKGEYLQYDVGSKATTVSAIPLLPPFQVNYVWHTADGNFFRFGVNYRF